MGATFRLRSQGHLFLRRMVNNGFSCRRSFTISSRTLQEEKRPDPYIENNSAKHVSLNEKFENLGQFLRRTEMCMVTTLNGNPGILVSRCMGLVGSEAGGTNLIFHTNTQSTKTAHLVNDPRVNMSFISAEKGEWASISGEATIITNRPTVRRWYSPLLKGWFPDLKDGVHDGGPEDPRIGVMNVKAIHASYALCTKEEMLGKNASEYTGTQEDMPQIVEMAEISAEDFESWREANNSG